MVGPPGARILVVEDERVLALDLAETLDELGYTVAGTATRGEEAIELARRLHPHLILMDVGLAGEIDGITAAETIRDEHDVPVVFLTAHADDDTLHRATSTRMPPPISSSRSSRRTCVVSSRSLFTSTRRTCACARTNAGWS